MFLVSIIHHSKIRELSDGNKTWKHIQTRFLSVGPTIFELWVMETQKPRGCLVFFFFFHHSSLLTQFLSLITYHSSLKIPQFPIPTRLAHFTHLLITQFFYFFVGPIPVKWSNHSVNKISFNHKTKTVTTTTTIRAATTPISPKTQTRTHKNFRSSLTSSGPSPVNNTHLSDVYGSLMG